MRTWTRLAEQGDLGRIIELTDGDTIFARNEEVDAAYFLAGGWVEIFQVTDDGRSFVVRILGAPCVFGVLEACGAEPRWLEGMRVLHRATIHKIELDLFHALLHREPEAALECLATTAMAFCRVAETEAARLAETEAMLAATLLVWAQLFGQDTADGRVIKLARSQAGLAAVVGASERQVQRIISAWRKSGAVDFRRGRYVVKDPPALSQMSNGFESGLLHRVDSVPPWVYR